MSEDRTHPSPELPGGTPASAPAYVPPPGSRPLTAPPSAAGPGRPRAEAGDLGAPQAVFDTVGGPNLRLRDNLIQLAAVIAAIPVTGVIALFFTRDLILVAVIAVMGGMLGGILVSGIALGIYRGLKGAERMSRK